MEPPTVVSHGADWLLLPVSSEEGRTGPIKVAWDRVTRTVMKRNFLISSSSFFPSKIVPDPLLKASMLGGEEGVLEGGLEGQGPLAPFKISFLGFGTFMAFNDLLLCPDCQSGHT